MLLALMACGLAQAARAEAPDFYLDLDTGGHRAFIKDIAFTRDGQYLVSASDDKTIRIWDWQAGATIRTLRGFVGPGNDGKIFAVAVSPDGKTIAAGGYFGAGLGDKPPYGDIRLFDFATGKVRATLKAADYAIYDVAFSPDGSFLAAGGQDGFIYVWRHDEAEATGWKAFTEARRRFLAYPATGLCRWRQQTGRHDDRQWHQAVGYACRRRNRHARRRAVARPAGDGAGGIRRRSTVCDRQQ